MIKSFRKLALPCVILAGFLSPAMGHAACTTTLASLHGWYGMLVSGATVAPTPAAKYLAGALLFDGAGGITADNILGGSNSDTTALGSYVLNADCTLTMTLTVGSGAPQVYAIALRASTNEAVGVETDAAAVATIDLQAQYATYTPGLNFTPASLNGTYAAACTGPLVSSSDLNLVTFNGGALSGTDPYNNGGTFAVANNPYTGTYTVKTDGTFVGSLVVGGTPFDFYGVISNAGAKVEYFYTNVESGAPTDAFASCVGGVVPAASLAGQTISFNAIPSQTVGTPLTLSASASSGLAVAFNSTTPAVCTVSGITATFLTPGSCTIVASQPGNAIYAAAMPVSQSFTVNAAVSSTGAVNLSPFENLYAVAANGSATSGLGNDGYSYSTNLLGTSVTWNGNTYTLGTPAAPSAVTSKTINLPAGSYNSLTLLGTGIYGSQLNQTFTVTYTDGTTSSFVQSLSDWGSPQHFAGESVAVTMAYRVTPSGATQNGPWYLYGYSFAINSAKTVKSLTLPSNRLVVVLAVDLKNVNLTAQTITFGSIAGQTVGATLALSATSSSGLPVTFASSTTGICTVSGSTASMLAVGTCTVVATQPGNAQFAAAVPVSQLFSVSAAATVRVNLAPVETVYAIAKNGSPNSGLGSSGYSYSANLLGTSLTWNGNAYTLGVPTSPSAVTGKVIPLPAGHYAALSFLGAGVYGNQINETFIVTYTDGTTARFTQSVSDWGGAKYFGGPSGTYPGESVAATTAYRVIPSGKTQNGPWYVYGYSFAINTAKTVKSFTLPVDGHLVVLAVDLSGVK